MEFSALSFFSGLFIGAVAGALLVWRWQRSRPAIRSANEVAKEHETLKRQVADHFVETAERVNQLTDSYKEVMEHLRSGALTLVDRETLQQRLPQLNENTEVRVARIGAQDAASATEKPKSNESPQ
jgi:hypothetical protein